MTRREETRLFAELLYEQAMLLVCRDMIYATVHHKRDLDNPFSGYQYLAFLHKQRQHYNAYCPYAMALALISKDAA